MYTAEISRNNPSMFLFLLDQSGSMQEVWGPEPTKAQGVANAINRLLQNLCITCAREEGVRDFFHIGVIGYGSRVGPVFGGSLAGRELVPLSEVAAMPARIEMRNKKVPDGAGGLVDQPVKFPVWFDPVANGGTPMCSALAEARRIVQGWITQHPSCFPPVVIHITDGESTDGDPTGAASSLRGLSSSDGEVLLFNLHISSKNQGSIRFPNSETELPDEYAKMLFQMSSPLTSPMLNAATQNDIDVNDGARGFAFNADLVEAIKFLEIGTRPSNLR